MHDREVDGERSERRRGREQDGRASQLDQAVPASIRESDPTPSDDAYAQQPNRGDRSFGEAQDVPATTPRQHCEDPADLTGVRERRHDDGNTSVRKERRHACIATLPRHQH